MKSTYAVINSEEKFLFKNPITDNGVKKSQRGKVYVYKKLETGDIKYRDGLTQKQYDEFEKSNLLKTIFENGVLLKETSLKEIRRKIKMA